MINGWNDERVELLKRLWADGLSASQIAKQLGGVTRNAVIGKVHRLGLAGRAAPSRPAKRPVPIARVKPAVAIQPEPRPVEPVAEAIEVPPARPAQAVPGAAARTAARGDMIGVLQLGPHMCKWPIGDPGDPDFGFCGAQSLPGGVYCAEHAAVAYQPAAARKGGDKARDDRAAAEMRRLARLAHF